MEAADYIVVGAGLTGATIARNLHDSGREVIVIDRRHHLGGNVYDHIHPSGIRIHTYGPHYFRTSSERIWEFATRFSDFYTYEASLLTKVDGELVPWPLWKSWIDKKIGPKWKPEFGGVPSNFEEAALSLMPRFIYDRFVKEYNEKQWGVPAASLDSSLCKRFDVRNIDEPRLKPDARFQGIPVKGYSGWTAAILDGIPARLGIDFLQVKEDLKAKRKLIFTGPIDEFFGFDIGKLKYRGQKRCHEYFPNSKQCQPVGQINTPQHRDGNSIRRLEWIHMMDHKEKQGIHGTVCTTETPFSPSEPNEFEYPFPDQLNNALYSEYRKKAGFLSGAIICGRLGEYRYYDMDQAIGRAMRIADVLLSHEKVL